MSGLGDFWNKLRRLFSPSRPTAPTTRTQPLIPSSQPAPPQPTEQQHGPLSVGEKRNIIHEAGRNRRMLEIQYDGVDRLVEPYSFRTSANGQLLFFGHCSIHSRIHSFKLEKISSIKISEFPFSPRWEIEL